MKTRLIFVTLLSLAGFIGCSPKTSGSDVNKKNQNGLVGQDPAQILLNNATVIKNGVSAFALKGDGSISDVATIKSKGGSENVDFCTIKEKSATVNIVGSEIREKDGHYIVTLRSVVVKKTTEPFGGGSTTGSDGNDSQSDSFIPSDEVVALNLDEDWATRNFRCIEAKNCAKTHHTNVPVVDCNAFASSSSTELPTIVKPYYGKECTTTAAQIPDVVDSVLVQSNTQSQANHQTAVSASQEVCTSLKGKKVFISKGVVQKVLNANVAKNNSAYTDYDENYGKLLSGLSGQVYGDPQKGGQRCTVWFSGRSDCYYCAAEALEAAYRKSTGKTFSRGWYEGWVNDAKHFANISDASLKTMRLRRLTGASLSSLATSAPVGSIIAWTYFGGSEAGHIAIVTKPGQEACSSICAPIRTTDIAGVFIPVK